MLQTSTARISLALMMGYIASGATALSLYRIDSIYRVAVGAIQVLTVLSLLVGIFLVSRECLRGQWRTALWPAALLLLTAAPLILLILGAILLPDPH